MPIVRVYTGADGVSHLEEIKDSIAATDIKKVTDLRFLLSEAGSGQRLNAPYGHYDITLSGQMDLSVADGASPGGVCLVEDQVDHSFIVVGTDPRIFIIARLEE
jgi:hypothetical protein